MSMPSVPPTDPARPEALPAPRPPRSAARAVRPGHPGGRRARRPARRLLEAGKGTLIRLPRPASTVFIANPDVADVLIKSPSLIYITAKAPGQTALYAVDAEDRVLLNAPVRVEHDLSRVRQSVHAIRAGRERHGQLGRQRAGAGRHRIERRARRDGAQPRRRDRQGDQGQRRQPDGGRDTEPGEYPGQGRRGEPRRC